MVDLLRAAGRMLRLGGAGFAILALAALAASLGANNASSPGLLPRSAQAEAAARERVEATILTDRAALVAAGLATPSVDRSGPPLQCVFYARERTGLELMGAARSWWPQAEGKYRRSRGPETGAVMVLDGTRGGHVAVVARVLNARQILIDHANWENGGEVTTGALAQDVSEAGDWSAVRVWHGSTGTLGLRVYPVFGFVHPD